MNQTRHVSEISLVIAFVMVAALAVLASGCGGPKYDPNVTVDTGAIDFNAALSRKVLDYFTHRKLCDVGYEKDQEYGNVLKITSKGVKKGNSDRPEVLFEYREFCKELGVAPVSIEQNPVVVLKVKYVSSHDKLVSLTGSNTTDDYSIKGAERTAKIANEGWTYLVFDLSDDINQDMYQVFRLNFEQIAVKNGETLLISEMRFVTVDKAADYEVPDVYEVFERTAGNDILNILTFNIQTEAGNNAPFAIRAALFRSFIEEHIPDIAGLQEVTAQWRKGLNSFVFNDSYDSFGAERTEGSEANTIYYRKDKFDLLDSGTFWLSPTPDMAGSRFSNSSYVRICSWGLFKDKVTGTEYVYYNTHLDINGDKEKAEGNALRAEQMAIIVRHAQQFSGKAIFVGGDFNTLRTKSKDGTHDAIQLVEGTLSTTDSDGNECRLTLKDTRLNAPVTVDKNHTATLAKYYDKSYSKYEPTREPIDYVFYTEGLFEPLTYETFLLAEGSYQASDHLAVFTTFKVING